MRNIISWIRNATEPPRPPPRIQHTHHSVKALFMQESASQLLPPAKLGAHTQYTDPEGKCIEPYTEQNPQNSPAVHRTESHALLLSTYAQPLAPYRIQYPLHLPLVHKHSHTTYRCFLLSITRPIKWCTFPQEVRACTVSFPVV